MPPMIHLLTFGCTNYKLLTAKSQYLFERVGANSVRPYIVVNAIKNSQFVITGCFFVSINRGIPLRLSLDLGKRSFFESRHLGLGDADFVTDLHLGFSLEEPQGDDPLFPIV